ncbi:MAG TPA: outer-membrane lipoprotein carrier protein LolA [Pyrinomonadaceae bacterium]|nr:outer-membrane lipoprotein carrier protein LolA [Pyrinomonadaceae bacterium]
MKKSVLFSFIGAAALLLSSLTLAPTTAGAQGAGLISSVFNRMERNRRDLRSLRAAIQMEKFNAQLGDKDNYFGDLIYLPGSGQNNSVRVDWQRPQRETLAVKDGKYTLFRPRLNMAYEGNANSKNSKASSVLGFGLNVSSQQLRANFLPPEYLGEGTLYGNVHVTWLKIVPKGRAGYKHAEIWVDDNGMPVQTKVVEHNNDSTTVRLTNVQRNARVSSDEFNLQLPSNVKRVRG